MTEGFGCKAIRVHHPDDLGAALTKAQEMAREHRLPVVVEVILEKVTNVSMGAAGLDAVNEFEPLALLGHRRPDRHLDDGLTGSLSRSPSEIVRHAFRHRPRQVQGIPGGAPRSRPPWPPVWPAELPDAEIDQIPVADGGEGTVRGRAGQRLRARSRSRWRGRSATPCGPPSLSAGRLAVIEMAAASGLGALPVADGRPTAAGRRCGRPASAPVN